MILINTIDAYTPIMLNWLTGLPEGLMDIAQIYFKLCLVSSNPVRDIYYCNY